MTPRSEAARRAGDREKPGDLFSVNAVPEHSGRAREAVWAGHRDGWCRSVSGSAGRRDAFLLLSGPSLIPTSAGPERHLLDLASPDRAAAPGAPSTTIRRLLLPGVRSGTSCGSPSGGRGDGAYPAPTASPHLPTEPVISETCRPARVAVSLRGDFYLERSLGQVRD